MKNGKLSFDEFLHLINTLYQMAREEKRLPFYIIKDLFEFIDKRQDQAIDLTEWMDVFDLKFNLP
jgi:Ca2+-binding EF-hand superfamily protein